MIFETSKSKDFDSSQKSKIFDIKDKTGRLIHLTKERWSHITTTHSEMANYLEEIKINLENPLKITLHKKGNLRNYYLCQKLKPLTLVSGCTLYCFNF